MSRLQWTFELLDRVSAPARRMGQALKGTETALRRVGGSGDAAQRALSRSFALSERAVRGLTAAISAIGTAQGGLIALQARVGALRGAIGGVTGAVFNLRNALVAGAVGFAAKSMIDQVGFIEQQRIALSTILGSPIRATAALEWAIKFADTTPFETPQVLEAMRSALAMGFNTRQIEPLLTTLGDTASALALGPTGFTELIQVFGQIRSAGKLMTEEVYQLTTRGIPAFEILAKAFKTDIPTLRKLIEKGQITSEAALGALYEGLRIRYGGGMEAQSRSIFGLVSTLRSRPQAIALRLEQGRALEPFRQLLQNLADLTDFSKPPGSTIGKQLEAGLGNLFKAAFGPLATATEPKAAAAAIETFLNRATAAVERARVVWSSLEAAALDISAGIRIATNLIAGLWRHIELALGFISRLTDSLGGVHAGLAGTGSPAIRLAATILTLAAAWRVLNLVTLGGAGALVRWSAIAGMVATRAAARLADPRGRLNALWGSLRALGSRAFTTVARVSVLGLSAVWAGIYALATLGLAALRASGQALLAGGRMAAAWLIGLGPIGWLVGAIVGIGGALVLAYKKVGWFRDAVGAAWTRIQQIGQRLFDWFSSLPERIGNVFERLPNLLRNFLRRAIDLLPPGVRDVVRGLVGGLLSGSQPVENAAIQLADKTQQGFARPLEVRSPSRRFAYFGQMMGAGLEVGMKSSLAGVQRAAASMAIASTMSLAVAKPPVLMPLSSASTPATRSVSITVGPITVSAPDARTAAEQVREMTVEAVLEALERAAIEEGA